MATIMLIEEDTAMRSLLTEWLRADGHVVVSSRWADRSLAEPADVVFIDVPDPQIQLRSRVDEILHSVPRAAVIGLSARLSREVTDRSRVALAPGLSALLGKPCSRREIRHAVADALQRTSSL